MLISPAVLNQLERQLGPKEDETRLQVLRNLPGSAVGGGFTKPSEAVVETVGARITNIANLNAAERVRAGVPRSDADFFISLKAGTDVRVTDVLREVALPWNAAKRVQAGQKSIPTVLPAAPLLYRCRVGGTTGDSEPTWPSEQGDVVTDGTVEWQCEGPCPLFDVISLMGPSTFGDYLSRKVFAKRREM